MTRWPGPEGMTKAEAIRWLERIREDAQQARNALDEADADAVYDLALDISGAAAKLAEGFEDS